MTLTEYQNIIKSISNTIEQKMLNDDSMYKGMKYQSYAPLKLLFEHIQKRADIDVLYKEFVISWLNNPCTITTRDVICIKFIHRINNKFKKDKRYPCPFDNAWMELDQINYKRKENGHL